MYNARQKGVTNMCAKMGRPKLDNPKATKFSVRMDDETLGKLNEIAKLKSVTRVQVIRDGIEIQYERIKK